MRLGQGELVLVLGEGELCLLTWCVCALPLHICSWLGLGLSNLSGASLFDFCLAFAPLRWSSGCDMTFFRNGDLVHLGLGRFTYSTVVHFRGSIVRLSGGQGVRSRGGICCV